MKSARSYKYEYIKPHYEARGLVTSHELRTQELSK